VKWSDQASAALVSSSPQARSVNPMGTLTYTVVTATDQRGCVATVSGQAVVTVIPPMPSVVTATAVTMTQVAVSWSYSGNADQFVVYRNGVPIATLASSTARSYADTSVSATQAYIYRVGASKTGVASPLSVPDLATTVIFENDPLTRIDDIRAQHILQLRAAVGAVRAAAGLPPPVFTDTSLDAQVETVKAVHFNELRTALDQGRTALGLPTIGYDRWPVQTGYEVWLTDVTALRAGVQ
jgi:fibronectin type 3 domain-containing protein